MKKTERLVTFLEKKVHTEENIELKGRMILSQKDQPGAHATQADIARKHNIDSRSVSHVIDQDLGFHPLGMKFNFIQQSYCQISSVKQSDPAHFLKVSR